MQEKTIKGDNVLHKDLERAHKMIQYETQLKIHIELERWPYKEMP